MRALALLVSESGLPVMTLLERLLLLQEEQFALDGDARLRRLSLLLRELGLRELLLELVLLFSMTSASLVELLLCQADREAQSVWVVVAGRRRVWRERRGSSERLSGCSAHSLGVLSRQLLSMTIVLVLLLALQLRRSDGGGSSLCSCDRVRSVKSGLIEGSRAEGRRSGDAGGSRLGRLGGWLLLLTLLLTGSVGRKGLQLRWRGSLTAGSGFRRRCSLLLLL